MIFCLTNKKFPFSVKKKETNIQTSKFEDSAYQKITGWDTYDIRIKCFIDSIITSDKKLRLAGNSSQGNKYPWNDLKKIKTLKLLLLRKYSRVSNKTGGNLILRRVFFPMIFSL